ncbi:hypothetical protein ENSA5_09960 [Enhygromyxa salina]|uniref:Lipoprotein n=1 Tax=Enhygromyxa salina TaxID=215803 RepID=A0A2S9YGP2_9BACT|nr:hypothetical protein [Enhygromyxa salina]PRQ04212.1 hypothetical protein ENSA5_09960 [Enhygromyxa salina]
MKTLRATLRLGLAVTVLAATGCGDIVEPIFDVRDEADGRRPALGSDSCASTGDLNVTSDQVIYAVHALPEQLDGSPAELELTVSTACAELTKTATHDEDGLALVPIALPKGAECGAVVTASIANASERCVLRGVLEGAGCSVDCGSAEAGDTETGDDSTETETGDDSTDSTG